MIIKGVKKKCLWKEKAVWKKKLMKWWWHLHTSEQHPPSACSVYPNGSFKVTTHLLENNRVKGLSFMPCTVYLQPCDLHAAIFIEMKLKLIHCNYIKLGFLIFFFFAPGPFC